MPDTIEVDIVARNQQFDSALKQSGMEMENFNVKMLSSKRFVKDFAELSDTPAKPILSMVRAFGAIPGPLGVALGAITAAKLAFDYFSEAAAKNAEKVEESIKKTQESIKSYEAEIKRMTQELNGTSQEERQLIEIEEKLIEIRNQRTKLAQGGTEKEAQEANRLAGIQEEYLMLQQRIKDSHKDDRFLEDQAFAAQKREEATDRFMNDLKQINKLNDDIEKQATASTDAMKKLVDHTKELNKTPLEHLMDQLQSLDDQLASGMLSAEEYGKAIARMQDDITKKMEKEQTAHEQSFRTVNTSLINVAALGKPAKSTPKDKVAEEQLAVQRKMLEALNKKQAALLGN